MRIRAFWAFSPAADRFLPLAFSRILDTLAPAERGGIGLIGAGGKTTLLHLLAEGLAQRSAPSTDFPRRVWAGTSTHLAWEAGFITDAQTAAVSLRGQKSPNFSAADPMKAAGGGAGDPTGALSMAQPFPAPVYAAAPLFPEEGGKNGYPAIFPPAAQAANSVRMLCPRKLRAFSPVESERLAALAAYSVIEADGSHRLPVKWPNETEPLLYPFLDTVLLVVGLSALGKPLFSVCQRVERAAAALHVDPALPLTPLLLARIIERGYLWQKAEQLRSRRLFLLLNQADTPAHRQAAGRIARYFQDKENAKGNTKGQGKESTKGNAKGNTKENAQDGENPSWALSFSAIWASGYAR